MAMNGTVRCCGLAKPFATVFGIGWSYMGWRGPYAMGIDVARSSVLVWRVSIGFFREGVNTASIFLYEKDAILFEQ